jgi:hypothetical protein
MSAWSAVPAQHKAAGSQGNGLMVFRLAIEVMQMEVQEW